MLRTLDLNASPTIQSGSGSSLPQRRKRQSDQHPSGREGMQWEDSDEEMFQSPRASPTSYRTLDGRTVTSRNPFSPYTPMDDTSAMSPMASHKPAPAFPVYLHQPTPSGITLQQRSSPFRQTYFGPSKSGFPDQQGRYSFTGSPIAEVDTDLGSASHKVRRLHQDDVTKSRRNYNGNMYINTHLACSGADEISPTDVSSFPPSTPLKKGRYNPLRSAPPQTPALDHRQRGRMSGEDEEDILIECSSQHESSSRFASDFDVIGQLGNGSFGTVFKCLSRLDGCMYAVKATKRKAKGVADRDRMLKEVSRLRFSCYMLHLYSLGLNFLQVYALAALSDQADTAAFHIVRYHQAWMEENRLYIQTELCSFTLETEMKRGPLTVERRYKLLREVLLALEFIHRNGMVHLDIKPENVFVKNDQYKLGDFGLVSLTHSSNDVEEGDSRYMSMELLGGDHSDLTKVRNLRRIDCLSNYWLTSPVPVYRAMSFLWVLLCMKSAVLNSFQ